MSASFRPNLESLEDRCVPSTGMSHLQVHAQIAVNRVQVAAAAAEIRFDQQELALLQRLAGNNQEIGKLQSDITADQAALQSLQQQGSQLAQLDASQDAARMQNRMHSRP